MKNMLAWVLESILIGFQVKFLRIGRLVQSDQASSNPRLQAFACLENVGSQPASSWSQGVAGLRKDTFAFGGHCWDCQHVKSQFAKLRKRALALLPPLNGIIKVVTLFRNVFFILVLECIRSRKDYTVEGWMFKAALLCRRNLCCGFSSGQSVVALPEFSNSALEVTVDLGIYAVDFFERTPFVSGVENNSGCPSWWLCNWLKPFLECANRWFETDFDVIIIWGMFILHIAVTKMSIDTIKL